MEPNAGDRRDPRNPALVIDELVDIIRSRDAGPFAERRTTPQRCALARRFD
jgi:hypothetical protein